VFKTEDLDGSFILVNPVISMDKFQDTAPFFLLSSRGKALNQDSAPGPEGLNQAFFAACGFLAATCLTMLMMSLSALLEKITV
jgi:hypothetical protein